MALEIRPLRDDERSAAGGVAGRALADGPMARWTYGDEPGLRIEKTLDVFVGYVETMVMPDGSGPIGALLGDHVVGICGAVPPGACVGVVAPPEWRTPPAEVGGPGDESRQLFTWSLFCGHDLDERHWHLGPVSVEPGLQGTGIGGRMLTDFCARMDREGEVTWLETDKPENVVFYRRHGFEVADELTEHGLTTWWMRRDPR